MLLYAALFLCAAVVAIIVYRYDMHDREPPLLLALTVGLGMGAMWLAGKAQVFWLEQAPGGIGVSARNTPLVAFLAATHEEAGKALAVLAIALVFRRRFNDPMDGIIYGSFAGLGAAVEESIAVLRHSDPVSLLPPAEVIRLLGHLVMGGIGGFGLGLAFQRHRAWGWALAGSFLAAVLLHFVWDLIALPANDIRGTGAPAAPTRGHSLAAIAVMLAGLVVYGSLVAAGSRFSRRAFAPGAPGLWGWPFR